MNPSSTGALAQTLNRIARRWGDDHYDEKAGLVYFAHPDNGHMTGEGAFLLRESSYYAYTLLRLGDEADWRRAEGMLRLVLEKQNLDESSPFWACFTCEYEQDWETWKHPDQNWAQFLGMIFAYILTLDRETPRLSGDVREKLESAFKLAVRATMRRDVRPAYSNIALLSSAVASAGDRLFGIDGADAFSTRKLSEVLARTEPATSFDEYLSPTYYATNLYALYSAERFGSGPVQDLARRLIDILWNDISRAYHPATHQLGGPHSRAYGDNMLEYAAKLKYYLFLALEGNYPLNEVETEHSHDCGSLALISTHTVEHRLSDVPRGPSFVRVTLPADEKGREKVLSEYQDEMLSLGSVSVENNWTQRRNLLAYWHTEPEGKIAVCKGLFQRDKGGVFIEPMFYSAQNGTGVLVGLCAPAAAQPDAAFSYRLEINLPCEGWTEEGNGSVRLEFQGLEMLVTPAPIQHSANEPTMEVMTGEGASRVVWRWAPAAAGQAFHVGAFTLACAAPGKSLPEIGPAAGVLRGDQVELSATVAGESLAVSIPLLVGDL